MTELLNTLYVQTPGTSLHLDGDTVRIYHPEQTGRRLLPLVRVDHLVIFGGVTVTDDLIIRCAADGRSISWLSSSGRFRVRTVGPTTGNPLLRQAQHRAADSNEQRHRLAVAMAPARFTTPGRSCSAPRGTRADTGRPHCAPAPNCSPNESSCWQRQPP